MILCVSFFSIAYNVSRLTPVAAAITDQNKTTDFIRKIKLFLPDYSPRRQNSKRKPSNWCKPLLANVLLKINFMYFAMPFFTKRRITSTKFNFPFFSFFQHFFRRESVFDWN